MRPMRTPTAIGEGAARMSSWGESRSGSPRRRCGSDGRGGALSNGPIETSRPALEGEERPRLIWIAATCQSLAKDAVDGLSVEPTADDGGVASQVVEAELTERAVE